MTHFLKRGPRYPHRLPSENHNNFYTIINNNEAVNSSSNNNNTQEETIEHAEDDADEDSSREENNNEDDNYWNDDEEEKNQEEEKEEDEEKDDCFNSSNNNIFYNDKDNEEQINKFIEKAKKIDLNLSQRCNDDSKMLFEEKSTSTCTVSEFARKFNNISATHGLSKAAMLDILNLFDQCTCNLNLPLKHKRKIGAAGVKSNHNFHFNDDDDDDNNNNDVENIDDDNLKEEAAAENNLDVDKYISEDSSKFEFHVCPKGCVVYIGLYAEKINCPICHTMRFSKCKHKGCQKKQYEECNPFDSEEGHSIKYRFALKSIYYRSSIILLAEKLLTARKNNLDYIDYLERRLNDIEVSDEYIVDTADSAPVRDNYKIMKKHFDEILQPKIDKVLKQNNIKKSIEMKNFILSGFFDGDTFFERKSDSGWMYLTGIQNCNPSDRMSLGKGLYLTLLHLEKSGGKVERFFMKNVMVGELRRLEQGVIIE
jgi:hypothetical protein